METQNTLRNINVEAHNKVPMEEVPLEKVPILRCPCRRPIKIFILLLSELGKVFPRCSVNYDPGNGVHIRSNSNAMEYISN